MSSTFDKFIDDIEVKINCPKCNGEFNVKMKQIGSNVACPYCKVDIKLEKDNTFDTSTNDIKKSLNDFEKTLKNFGK